LLYAQFEVRVVGRSESKSSEIQCLVWFSLLLQQHSAHPQDSSRLVAMQCRVSATQRLQYLPGFTASFLSFLHALGRNLAIEVLEFFDRAGYTRRIGEGRLVLKAPREVFGDG